MFTNLVYYNSIVVFAVTQTWLSLDILSSDVNIPNYIILDWIDWTGGGVKFYVRNQLEIEIIHGNIQETVIEQFWFKHNFSGK